MACAGAAIQNSLTLEELVEVIQLSDFTVHVRQLGSREKPLCSLAHTSLHQTLHQRLGLEYGDRGNTSLAEFQFYPSCVFSIPHSLLFLVFILFSLFV